MIAAVLWISSLLACALMTSSVPHEDVASRVFHHRVSSQGSNDLPTDTQKRHDQDHVTMSPQSDSSDTHYGAHLIDRTVLFPHDTTWCVARPISQVIESPGCTARTIPNKVNFLRKKKILKYLMFSEASPIGKESVSYNSFFTLLTEKFCRLCHPLWMILMDSPWNGTRWLKEY